MRRCARGQRRRGRRAATSIGPCARTRRTHDVDRMASRWPLVPPLLLLSAAAGSTILDFAPSSAICLQQLAKDGCSAEDGPQRCGACAQRHRGDLLGANCSEAFVTQFCEHKFPPSPDPGPPSGCASWCGGHQGSWPEKCKWTACDKCPRCHASPPSPPRPINSSTLTVLVFGDSWGSLGPSWRALQDTFDRHGVDAVVRSSAVGGTQACQWAATGTNGPGSALADAAKRLFP